MGKKLDQDTFDKWISALRSGEYRQGRGALRSKDDRFCCLGVLAYVEDPEAWEIEPEQDCYTFKGVNTTFLHNRIGYQTLLANMNDRSDSFHDIADWIESSSEQFVEKSDDR